MSAQALSMPNGHAPSSASPSPEIEQTLSRLSAYRNVKGVMVLARRPASVASTVANGGTVSSAPLGQSSTTTGPSIIQSSGSVFEGETGRNYARILEGVVGNVARGIADCDEGVS